ncbi:glycosyltransferase family 9 protein [Flavihumibacter petaseus]|uniref:Putative glycosyltransferase n=1 Tax=Flavihumibacter petaseus NBRC 106054 TaxID=1220578 RepID=A0A0E9N0P6_9BACT|nr:glycosyltransferase family 9 protein [Flavihumibacter petaseus]GAO42925.1 putative glycosyltransferase [Flavihumibacter petaseus NBRC 106054]
MKKILVIRFSSIGDIVLTTPVLRCIKQQLPDAELHFLVKKSFAPVLIANPYIDKLHLFEDDLTVITDSLKKENFDFIVDLHHNLRTLRVKRALAVKSKSFNKLNVQKWLLTALKINVLPDKHIVDRYLEAAAPLGVVNDGKGLDYFIPENEKIADSDLPAAHQLGYIGLVIGAAHATKRMPVEKLEELVGLLDHPIILLGGPEDKATGARLEATDPIKVYNACGKFSLNESADLVRRAKLIISNDTGLMHIAAAFRKPVISLWGNTVPEFGMYPYYGKRSFNQVLPFEIVERKGLRCRPCSKIGYDACPKGHFKCMREIPVPAIRTLVQQWLLKA